MHTCVLRVRRHLYKSAGTAASLVRERGPKVGVAVDPLQQVRGDLVARLCVEAGDGAGQLLRAAPHNHLQCTPRQPGE